MDAKRLMFRLWCLLIAFITAQANPQNIDGKPLRIPANNTINLEIIYPIPDTGITLVIVHDHSRPEVYIPDTAVALLHIMAMCYSLHGATASLGRLQTRWESAEVTIMTLVGVRRINYATAYFSAGGLARYMGEVGYWGKIRATVYDGDDPVATIELGTSDDDERPTS
ncbi:MAG: hypothetical protein Q9163_001310 [Psora crenata]